MAEQKQEQKSEKAAPKVSFDDVIEEFKNAETDEAMNRILKDNKDTIRKGVRHANKIERAAYGPMVRVAKRADEVPALGDVKAVAVGLGVLGGLAAGGKLAWDLARG